MAFTEYSIAVFTQHWTKYCSLVLFVVMLTSLSLASCDSPSLGGKSSQQNQKQKACYQNFGITLSGAEGVGQNYTRPTDKELAYYSAKHVKLIRLEIGWDKVQPLLNGPLNADELRWIEHFISYADHMGMQVDIDLHQRSTYDDLNFKTGNGGLDPASLADFWGKFAGKLVKDAISGICGFGIANEPNHARGFYDQWPGQANATIAAIRKVDHIHFIFVGEDRWDSSSKWSAEQAALIHDPVDRLVFEAHSYWDTDNSGTYDPDEPPASSIDAQVLVTQNLKPFFDWCGQTNNKCFVGEFGIPPDKQWLNALDFALNSMLKQQILGAYWAGGPNYDDTLSIEPVNGKDSPQMSVLAKYLA